MSFVPLFLLFIIFLAFGLWCKACYKLFWRQTWTLVFLTILFLLICFAIFSFCLLVNALQFYIFACFAFF
jgi:hypothetical protein